MHCGSFSVAYIGFDETVHTVSEADNVRVCVHVTPSGCEINFPFDISFTTIDGTAGN